MQLLAGMWKMQVGDTLGAFAFSSDGGFCIGTAALFIQSFGFLDYHNGTDALNNALGFYFLAWTLFTFFMLTASHRTTVTLFPLSSSSASPSFFSPSRSSSSTPACTRRPAPSVY